MGRTSIAVVLLFTGGCADQAVEAAGGGGGASASIAAASTSTAAGGGEGPDQAASAASTTVTSVTTTGPGAGGGGGDVVGSGGGGGGELERPCAGQVRDCGNGLDDDDDGLVDSDDPDCIGACDLTEDLFQGHIPGADGPPCAADCFFDEEYGSGNDGCSWSWRCDPTSVAPSFDPTGDPTCEYSPDEVLPGIMTCDELREAQSDACHEYCDALVPNGCDCFGCCELPAGSGRFAWLQSGTVNGDGDPIQCSTSTMDDPSICRACEPVPSCFNPCDGCETCLGGAAPDGCTDAEQCPGGEPVCGRPGQARCPAETYCVTGCCQPLPV